MNSNLSLFFRNILLLLLFLFSFSSLSAQDMATLLRKADSLTHHEQGDAALEIYDQILQKDSRQKTALVQAGLLTLRKAKRQTNTRIADSLYNRAKLLTETALQRDPNYPPSTYAKALSLYVTALQQGVKEKIKGLKEVKDYLDRTLLLDSTYAPAWHLLGQWNMAFNKMNFAERAAVKLFFGGMPKANATIAITDFLKCKTLAPSFVLNYYHLGLAYHANGEDLKAISTLNKAVHLRPILQDDRHIQQKCKNMLEKLQ